MSKSTNNRTCNKICDVEIISYSDETFSQICVRYGDLLQNDEENGMTPQQYEEDYITSVQLALQSFCEDNPKITEESFKAWYQRLIDDEELFRLDKPFMLSMIGFGENLGSGFPKIFAAWKETNWGEPELKNKIEL